MHNEKTIVCQNGELCVHGLKLYRIKSLLQERELIMIKIYKGAYSNKELIHECGTINEAINWTVGYLPSHEYIRIYPLNGMYNVDNTRHILCKRRAFGTQNLNILIYSWGGSTSCLLDAGCFWFL